MTNTETRDSTSPISRNAGVYGAYEKDRVDSAMRMDSSVEDMEDGAMVVMYFGPGMLVVVKQNGKYWELEPLAVPEDSEDMTLHFFPSEAVFTVVRKGRYVGFKSVVAEGRTLQAVAAEENAPLRVNNYNFGAWEMWEPTGSGFVNRKWPQKMLNLEVCEIQTVSLDNLRKLERNTMKTSRDMQKQVKSLELQRHKLEREIGELNRTKKRQAIQHTREIEDSRARLDEALALKQKMEVEGVQTGTKLRRQELVISQLTYQRDSAAARLKEVEANRRSEDRHLEALKEKYESELSDKQRSFQTELQALKKEKDAEIDLLTSRANEEIRVLKQQLDQTELNRDRDLRVLQNEHENLNRQRALEREQLKEENSRLFQALQVIQQKVQHGFLAARNEEVQLSFSRAGCDDHIRSGNASPMQRYSTASRNSNRRGEEFHDGVPQVERSALSSESLPRGYLERGTLGQFDTLSTRSSNDYGYQRRADSRTSDCSKLNLQGDELHGSGGMNRRYQSDSRRQLNAVHAPNSARRSSPLNSIEVEEEQIQKNYHRKDYESDTDASGSLTEDSDDLNEDKKTHDVHRPLVEREELAIVNSSIVVDDNSERKVIDSESTATMNGGSIPTQPEELLDVPSISSDRSQSMVVGERTPSVGLPADSMSDESDDSENNDA